MNFKYPLTLHTQYTPMGLSYFLDIKPAGYIITKSFIWWYSFGILHHVVVKCSDVSVKHTASIFRLTELIWLYAQERRRNTVDCLRRLPPYHCSIQSDEFRRPEDGGSMFFRKKTEHLTTTRYKTPKHDHPLTINNRRESLKTCNMALHNPYCGLSVACSTKGGVAKCLPTF